MTLNEAVEYYQTRLKNDVIFMTADQAAATLLGYEALKREADRRRRMSFSSADYYPGETEE